MEIIIRTATLEDNTELFAMIRELAVYEKLEHEFRLIPDDLAKALFGETTMAEALVACDGDKRVAYAIYFHNFSTFHARRGLYLEDLYVRPQYRGKGIGKRLLGHLAQIAAARDCSRFEWIVLDWNEPAIRFYESLGAQIKQSFRVCRVDGKALARLAGKQA
ncbi:GNAT family N-acetyltransferase [bacterium]|nr:GNAT family N-acetyltransferase [bacterium]